MKSLVEEIAPLARAEVDARKAFTTAENTRTTVLNAAAALGDAYTAAADNIVDEVPTEIPATGARAVLRAADAVKESVEKQQAFHDARQDWAEDILAPLQTTFNDAQAAFNLVSGQVDTATDELAAAK